LRADVGQGAAGHIGAVAFDVVIAKARGAGRDKNARPIACDCRIGQTGAAGCKYARAITCNSGMDKGEVGAEAKTKAGPVVAGDGVDNAQVRSNLAKNTRCIPEQEDMIEGPFSAVDDYASAVFRYDGIRDQESYGNTYADPCLITFDCAMGDFQRAGTTGCDPGRAGTGHIVNDEVIEVDCSIWIEGWGDVNRGAAIGVDARPRW
jgi:hypothetical protein